MFHSFLNAFWQEEDGQDLVEYALLLAFIGLAATAALTTVTTNLNAVWSHVNSKLATAATQ
jgi:pilus assembly protein Flp/PilA